MDNPHWSLMEQYSRVMFGSGVQVVFVGNANPTGLVTTATTSTATAHATVGGAWGVGLQLAFPLHCYAPSVPRC